VADVRPLAVVAVGGNALTGAGQEGTAEQIRQNAAEMAQGIVGLRERCRVVVAHGNGPQVGNLSIQQAAAAGTVPAQPLHQLGAMTQGQLGSVLVVELDRLCGSGAAVAVVTHAVVDPQDPAFANPVKPIGPFFSERQAQELAAERGWQVREDSGRGYRRVVPSPTPVEIVEVDAIRVLVDGGYLVVAAGGGGIPVVRAARGALRSVDAVIDKDRAAALLASQLGAAELYLLTGVDAVRLDFGTPQERVVHRLTAAEAQRHLEAGQFPAGSMGPKIQAAQRFLADGGRRALITSAAGLAALSTGAAEVGTSIVPESAPVPAGGTR
jgi:carbamate kinase